MLRLALKAHRPVMAKALPAASTLLPQMNARCYASGPGPLTRDFVQQRIMDVLSNCDKVDAAKLTPTAKFQEDLGLDSLDVVDALFFIEEEFTVLMPE